MSSTAHAQEIISSEESIEVRKPTEDAVQKYMKDSRFKYGEIAADTETLWSRFRRWLDQKLDEFLSRPLVDLMLRITFYLTIAAIFIALVNQFMKGNIASAFTSGSANKKLSLNFKEEHIESIDLDTLLNEAIRDKNFERAVVLFYHKALQRLNDLQLIEWKVDKTNHDYLYELQSHKSKGLFSRLTHYYEYVEYGDFPVRESDFNSISDCYQEFNKSLGS